MHREFELTVVSIDNSWEKNIVAVRCENPHARGERCTFTLGIGADDVKNVFVGQELLVTVTDDFSKRCAWCGDFMENPLAHSEAICTRPA